MRNAEDTMAGYIADPTLNAPKSLRPLLESLQMVLRLKTTQYPFCTFDNATEPLRAS